MNACPLLLQRNALKCTHCNPKEAPCANACKAGAFFEIAEGILAIDEEKCNGCGECIEACPHNAISLNGEKARKCSLCAENDFVMACIEGCPHNALSFKWDDDEFSAVERTIGWRVFPVNEKECRVLRKSRLSIIVKNAGKKFYLLESFPCLSKQEALLLREILEEFRASDFKKHDLKKAIERHCSMKQIELGKEQKEYFLNVLNSLVYGLGPLTTLLEDEELEEIALIGLGKSKPLKVFHRDFGWLDCNAYFSSESAVRNIVNKMLAKSERRLSIGNPRVNGVLSDGSRVNATLPPVSIDGPTFTIRKFHTQKMTPLQLIKNKTFSAELMAFLWLTVLSECSIIVAGNTGSGKTTTLNALLSFVPKQERIIAIEETPEMRLPHSHCVRLSTFEKRGIKMQNLIADSLRMRPDRIIIGEVREKEEVMALIDTLLAGQGKGSYATMHALSAREAITRMKTFGVKNADLKGIDLVLVQKRWTETDLKKNEGIEKRRIVEVAELSGEKNVKPRKLFSFCFKKDRIGKSHPPKKVMEKMKIAFGLSKNKVELEIKKRAGVLEEWKTGNCSLNEFFNRLAEF